MFREWISVARLLIVLSVAVPWSVWAQTAPAKMGIVVMHGKGGSPNVPHMRELVSGLQAKGYLVANLEMPWSGRRNYDKSVASAEEEVSAALDKLRSEGAAKLFLAGHSQGGVFALYYGSQHAVDGVIAIAPGGSVDAPVYRQYAGAAVDLARSMVADGKGSEQAQFVDYEGSRGTSPVHTSAAIYLTWFDPAGAMNQQLSSKAEKSPVLYIAPTNDYPALQRIKRNMYAALRAYPQNRLYEPSATHIGAPGASIEEIARWTAEVAGKN